MRFSAGRVPERRSISSINISATVDQGRTGLESESRHCLYERTPLPLNDPATIVYVICQRDQYSELLKSMLRVEDRGGVTSFFLHRLTSYRCGIIPQLF